MPTPSRTVYVLLRIAGYTWFKTYRTIEMLADTPSTATTRWLEHKQTELNFASLIVSRLNGDCESVLIAMDYRVVSSLPPSPGHFPGLTCRLHTGSSAHAGTSR